MTEEYENKLVQCPMCNGLGHVRIGPQSQYILSTIFDSPGKSRNTIGWPCVSCPLCAGTNMVKRVVEIAFRLLAPNYGYDLYRREHIPITMEVVINAMEARR